ncbi:MAG: hypothetical protein R3C12_26420, partial [Planctomycetaceae bacterium]
MRSLLAILLVAFAMAGWFMWSHRQTPKTAEQGGLARTEQPRTPEDEPVRADSELLAPQADAVAPVVRE